MTRDETVAQHAKGEVTPFAKAHSPLYNLAMQQRAKPKMTVDEFFAWAEENPGRYELSEGEVYAMSPERLGHAKTKFAVQSALLAAIRKAGLPCHMIPDGATVRINKHTAYEPDALVYCGPERPDTEIEVPDPVIVVEVLSPGTRHIDNAAKLSGYFAVPSVCHYLIVDIGKRLILHHARGQDDVLTTRIVRDGVLALDPPGIALDFDSCFNIG